MVHTAVGLRQDGQPAPRDGLHQLDRAGRDQHDHRRGAGDDQPAAGAAAAGRHLRHPRPGARAAAARTAGHAGRVGQRLLQAGVALLGSDQPARAADHLAARGAARADLAGRDRRGHAVPAAGRADRGVRLPRGALPQARVDHPAAAAGPRPAARSGGAAARVAGADDHRRRRGDLQRGDRRAGAIRRGDRHPGGRDHGRARERCRSIIRRRSARSA